MDLFTALGWSVFGFLTGWLVGRDARHHAHAQHLGHDRHTEYRQVMREPRHRRWGRRG